MAINSYDFTSLKRDLTDVLSTLIADAPGFIRLFPVTGQATQPKHEWLENHLKPKRISYSAYDATTTPGTFTVTDSSGWTVGDYVKILGNPAIFKITSTTSTTIVVSLVASNGGYSALSSTGAPSTSAGSLCFVAHPMSEASSSGLDAFCQSSVAWNATQIIRRDFNLSGTSIASSTHGNENSIVLQEAEALRQIINELNDTALFGVRSLRTSSALGTAGGLYYFGTQNGCLSSAQANTPALSTAIINGAAQKIVEAGGIPSIILCGIGQARVISRLYSTSLQVQQYDKVRGSYVSQIVNEATGGLMQVFVEPKLDDTDVWVIDPSAFGLVWLRNLISSDATSGNMDGQCRKLIGEATFEFKNAKQKLCRISGLQASSSALA
ncbi:MAG: DUF5309 family protein [Planctomycetia bacterium]|nr:DUF5309 family protein [Planctomycetia bacterium]